MVSSPLLTLNRWTYRLRLSQMNYKLKFEATLRVHNTLYTSSFRSRRNQSFNSVFQTWKLSHLRGLLQLHRRRQTSKTGDHLQRLCLHCSVTYDFSWYICRYVCRRSWRYVSIGDQNNAFDKAFDVACLVWTFQILNRFRLVKLGLSRPQHSASALSAQHRCNLTPIRFLDGRSICQLRKTARRLHRGRFDVVLGYLVLSDVTCITVQRSSPPPPAVEGCRRMRGG
ncbi:hypothetical protein FB446DRAFT_245767 [Lentinula raphanica]|nr:hypothetical protein FB446DRAFT_245767 [Lentinula raphanica]